MRADDSLTTRCTRSERISPITKTLAAMRKKTDLPIKTCPVCGRPFSWRKKWARVWHEVRYCSERCRRQRPDKP